MTRKKILFVDDDADWRGLVSTYLEESGYDVLTAKDASEALAKADSVKLALIILDLDLAGENGLVLMSFLKRNQADVPIILYTGLSHDDEQIVDMLRKGALQYARKGPLAGLSKAVEVALA
jgi:DNA-binding response OmpR family regulator